MQGDQHVQREEQEDDDHSCSNLEDNFAEEKLFDNQESFRLAETKLYNKPVSCTTATATNRGREGRRHTSNNMYSETSTEYCDRVKLAAQGDPVQTITTFKRMAMKKNLRTEYDVMELYGMIVYVMMEVEKQRDNVRRVGGCRRCCS